VLLTPDCSRVKYLVAIPTRNEVRAIDRVIDEALSAGIPREDLVVVDGGSTDGTREVVLSRGIKLVDQVGRGKVGAVMTVARLADGYNYVVFLDGDYTYPATYIPELVRAACEGGYDLVIGARKYFEPGSQSAFYRLGNRLLTAAFNALFGINLSDVLSGMYVVRSDILRELAYESRGFGVEVELVAHVVSLGYRVHELPIRYRRRADPRAKKLRVFHGAWIAMEILRMAWRYNPVFTVLFAGALLLVPGLALGAYVAYHYFFTGIKYYVKGIVAIVLTLAGFQSFLLSIISLYLKRVELRLLRLLKSRV